MIADVELDDRGEIVSLMEPLVISEGSRHRGMITDLAFDLTQKAAGFRRSLPPSLLASLADLVRAMNCYYSNLIEGHDTHPVDIERALKNEYSRDSRKRNLQFEAKAHIAVQRWIDAGGLRRGHSIRGEGICEIHRRFCELLPEDLLWVEDPRTNERIRLVRGELRKRDIRVGGHLAISPGAVPRFLKRFGGDLREYRQNRVGYLDGGGPPSAAMDSPVPGRQWPSGAADVAWYVAGDA